MTQAVTPELQPAGEVVQKSQAGCNSRSGGRCESTDIEAHGTEANHSQLLAGWRMRMFLEILSAAGGQSDAGDWPGSWINAFCETHEGQNPDTFNKAIDLGYTRSTHDSDTDHAVVYLTKAGRSLLTATPQPPVVGEPSVMPSWEDEAAVERCAKAMWECDEHTYSDRVWSNVPEYGQDLWRDRARACLSTLVALAAQPADERMREALEVGQQFLTACMSAWSCGEPSHRVQAMLERADEFQAALDYNRSDT